MTPTSRAGTSSSRGFTLIELIAVVFILSLLMVSVYPAFSRLGKGAMNAEAKRTASVLRFLNDTAVAKKETIALNFHFSTNTITWESSEGRRSETLEFLTHIDTPSTGIVKDGEITFFFGPLGPGDDLEVGLGDGERGVSVKINRISGKVKIYGEGAER